MSRIACLRIPRFQIVVHQKHEPSLKGRALVLLAGKSAQGVSNRTAIFMCSAEAERLDIHPGMKLSEARALCADLIWRECDSKLYLDAQNKLMQTLIAYTPRVGAMHGIAPANREQLGTFILDASGLTHLGGESKFCSNVLRHCGKSGFVDGRIGVADSAFAALISTRFKHRRWCIVLPGGDAAFLAPLSVRHLPADREMQEALTALGLREMGQLAGVPADSIAERFGNAGTTVWELAQGIDRRQPMLPTRKLEFESSVDLGYPVESLNQTAFILKSMLDRLTGELKQKSLWAEELELSFYNDNDMFDQRTIKLIRPSNNARFLVDIVKLSLEAQPLTREFTGLTVSAPRFTKEAWEQMELAAKGSHSKIPQGAKVDESLLLLLQRFKTRFGDDAVVRPVANDQHFPENAGAWIPVLQNPASGSVVPIDIEYIRNYAGCRDLTGGLVLKRAPEPIPVLIRLQDSTPTAVAYRGRWYQVKHITTPECLSGLWWDRFIRKSYYVTLLAESLHGGASKTSEAHGAVSNVGATPCVAPTLVLLVHDHQSDCWYLEGFFD